MKSTIKKVIPIALLALPTLLGKTALAANAPSGWDTNFYACVEKNFEEEFPDESIPTTGLSDEQLSRMEQLVCPHLEGQTAISNVFGLDKMTALKYISLNGTLIEEIDFSPNLALESIVMDDNRNLVAMDTSSNLALKSIKASGNEKLNTLDVSKNEELESLWLSDDSGIYSIDVTNNNKLTSLAIDGTGIQSIDISSQLAADHKGLSGLPAYFKANDGTIIRTGIIGQGDSGLTVFDFSNLWLLDQWKDESSEHEMVGGYNSIQYIPVILDSEYYTYDPQLKKLYVSNLDLVDNYATVVAKYIRTQSGTAIDIEPIEDVTEVSYRILLESNGDVDKKPGTPNTGMSTNTDNQNYLGVTITALPIIIYGIIGVRYFIRNRKSIKLD